MTDNPKEVHGIPQHYHWISFGRDELVWWWPFITQIEQQNRRWKSISWFGIECEIRYK